MPANATITALFAQLTTQAALRELVDNKVQESLYLEFKQKKDVSRPELSSSDASNFSKVLSGFANADGGVLVWGIETDKSERAVELHPIADVLRFSSGSQIIVG